MKTKEISFIVRSSLSRMGSCTAEEVIDQLEVFFNLFWFPAWIEKPSTMRELKISRILNSRYVREGYRQNMRELTYINKFSCLFKINVTPWFKKFVPQANIFQHQG